MRRVGRLVLQRLDDDALHVVIADRARPAGPTFVMKAVEGCSENRRRQLRTVASALPSRPATAVFEPPSAHANTIRQRNANDCEVVARRAHGSNVSRSSPDNTISIG